MKLLEVEKRLERADQLRVARFQRFHQALHVAPVVLLRIGLELDARGALLVKVSEAALVQVAVGFREVALQHRLADGRYVRIRAEVRSIDGDVRQRAARRR